MLTLSAMTDSDLLHHLPSGKLTQTLAVVGVGRLVSIKNGWFSGSMLIYWKVIVWFRGNQNPLSFPRIHQPFREQPILTHPHDSALADVPFMSVSIGINGSVSSDVTQRISTHFRAGPRLEHSNSLQSIEPSLGLLITNGTSIRLHPRSTCSRHMPRWRPLSECWCWWTNTSAVRTWSIFFTQMVPWSKDGNGF